MKLTALIALVGCVALALFSAPSASAKTYVCKAGTFGYYDPTRFPSITRLRATLPRRTEGMTACEVAEIVAAAIQQGFDEVLPRELDIETEETYLGRWRCVYKDRTDGVAQWATARCHEVGHKGYRYVTMKISS